MEHILTVRRKRLELKDLTNLELSLYKGIRKQTGKKLRWLRKRGIGIKSLLIFTLNIMGISNEFIMRTYSQRIMRAAEVYGYGENLGLAKQLLLELNIVMMSILRDSINGGMAIVAKELSFLMT